MTLCDSYKLKQFCILDAVKLLSTTKPYEARVIWPKKFDDLQSAKSYSESFHSAKSFLSPRIHGNELLLLNINFISFNSYVGFYSKLVSGN